METIQPFMFILAGIQFIGIVAIMVIIAKGNK